MCDTDSSQFVSNLKTFIEEQKTWLQNTLDSVGWDISKLENFVQNDEPNFVSCSINPEHRIPRERLLNHESRCEKRNGDYPKITDLPYSDVATDDVKNSIRFVSDCDDGSSDNLDSSATIKNKSEEKINPSTCLMELLAAERDAKRRRAAHRGKRVHSNKKSHVEVLREVISSQMETLNGDSGIEIKPEIIETESSQKTIIQPRADSYLGVGSKCFSGNPFKRWMTIEEEEQDLIGEMQNDRNKKHLEREYDRLREDTHKKYIKHEKSSYDDDNARKRYQKHREYSDRHRGDSKSVGHRDSYSYRSEDKGRASRYDEEKYSRRNFGRDDSERNRRGDSFSESYETSDKHKKKSKKKSPEENADFHDSSDKHKKKRKKKSHERSVHKKKHRKSKHSDSEAELNYSR